MSVAPTRTDAAVGAACWSCSAPTGRGQSAHFCLACGKIQALPRGMSYFAFFDLPAKLDLDADDLERRFLALSWKLHPDNFVRASEEERALALERSSELNDAYRTLRDPIARVEYLLAREGVRKEGEKKQQAPPELLEEVFELNESLDELRMARQSQAELEALRQRLVAARTNFQEKLGEVDAELGAVRGEWDKALDTDNDDAARRAIMARMNEILNRRSYIRNLVNNVEKELTES